MVGCGRVEVRTGVAADRDALALEVIRQRVHGGNGFGIRCLARLLGPNSDAQILQTGKTRGREVEGQAGFVGVRASQDVQRGDQVGGGAAEGADDGDVRPRGGTGDRVAVVGQQANVGLWPNTPQKCAGTRIEPPMSLPISNPVSPAASAAADPPEEPPGVWSVFQGLEVVP